MYKPLSSNKRGRVLRFTGFLILFTLLACLAACSSSSEDNGLRQTEISMESNATRIAEQEAALATRQTQLQATLDSPTATPDPTPTPALTDTPVPTETPLASISPEVDPTATATAIPTEIFLTDWTLDGFVESSDKCRENAKTCWIKDGGGGYLLSTHSILIDNAWSNPYLVFHHKYKIVDEFCNVIRSGRWCWYQSGNLMIQAGGGWLNIRSYAGSVAVDWHDVSVDLNKYSGTKILIQFGFTGSVREELTRYTYWYIQDIRIVPNFTP